MLLWYTAVGTLRHRLLLVVCAAMAATVPMLLLVVCMVMVAVMPKLLLVMVCQDSK
jgi:hypothetical protein